MMNIKVYDILTINDNKYVVAFILNYQGQEYYYLTNKDVENDLKFIYIDKNEFYEVQDSKLILDLFAEIAKKNI